MENRELEQLLVYVDEKAKDEGVRAVKQSSLFSSVTDGIIIRVLAKKLGLDLDELVDDCSREYDLVINNMRKNGVSVSNFEDFTGVQGERPGWSGGEMAPTSQN